MPARMKTDDAAPADDESHNDHINVDNTGEDANSCMIWFCCTYQINK